MGKSRATLYLIDGSSYVYRAFFALPPLHSPSGMQINAVYGVASMLIKLLADTKPEYIGFVVDAPGKTFRDKLFEGYKANRPSTPGELTAQIPYVYRVVEAFRVALIAREGVEADDVIATVVHRLPEGFDCVVVTGDKDLMQLVGPRVRLWDTMRDRWTDVAAVEARLGVKPGQVVEVMALMGDSIDNIPGVRGIGEKTAVALIREFGDLEGVLKHLDDVERLSLRGAKKIASLLREGAESARLSRQLAMLNSQVPLDFGVEDLRYPGPDASALRELFGQLGFQSLLRQLPSSSEAVQVKLRHAGEVAPGKLLADLANCERISVGVVVPEGVAVATPATELVVCALDGEAVRFNLASPEDRQVARSVLENGPAMIVVHDLKRVLHALRPHELTIGERCADVMLASYLLEAAPNHDMRTVAQEVLGARVDKFSSSVEGCASGVVLLGKLWETFESELKEKGLVELFRDVEMPLARVLARMEAHGLLLDLGRLRSLSEEYSERLEVLIRGIYELAGGEFNINSPPQLREILFERLGLSRKGVRKGKTGYSTDVDVLTRLAAEHPLPARILDYRALAKLKSTYIDALPAALHPGTGRLHTTFHQTVAATGRLSSSDPNLQNIPIRGEEGRRIRAAFVAPAGHCLLAADYSQIELRVLAHLSGDPALVEAFGGNEDIHTRTAAEIFGVMPGTVTADMRRAAKVINFGIIYGMGPQRLAQELSIPLARAQEYIASYLDRYSGVKEYMRSVIEEARSTGFVRTILGRRRSVGELRSPDRFVAQAAERVATNTPIQGSAADIIKLAMVAVDRRLAREGLRAALVLQVHDELLLEVPNVERDKVAQIVREEMEGVLPMKVALKVEIGMGRNWAEAH